MRPFSLTFGYLANLSGATSAFRAASGRTGGSGGKLKSCTMIVAEPNAIAAEAAFTARVGCYLLLEAAE
jgi:hypothetical protein